MSMFPGVSKTIEQFPTKGLGGVSSVTYDPPTKKAYGRSYFSTSFPSAQSVVYQSSANKDFNTHSKVHGGNHTVEVSSHGFPDGKALVYTKDAATTTLKNDDGEEVLVDKNVYYTHSEGLNHFSLHHTEADAIAGTNVIEIEPDASPGANSYLNTGAFITQTNHGYKTGNAIVYDRDASGQQLTLGSGAVTDLQILYVVKVDNDNFYLSNSYDDAVNDKVDVITNDGHDTQQYHPTYGITS